MIVSVINIQKEHVMENELTQTHHTSKVVHQGGGSNPVYGIGMIGAWVYYIGRATTPQEKAIGFLKGLVWPAFLVYELLVFLKKE
jgi:hypothetical protein